MYEDKTFPISHNQLEKMFKFYNFSKTKRNYENK